MFADMNAYIYIYIYIHADISADTSADVSADASADISADRTNRKSTQTIYGAPTAPLPHNHIYRCNMAVSHFLLSRKSAPKNLHTNFGSDQLRIYA